MHLDVCANAWVFLSNNQLTGLLFKTIHKYLLGCNIWVLCNGLQKQFTHHCFVAGILCFIHFYLSINHCIFRTCFSLTLKKQLCSIWVFGTQKDKLSVLQDQVVRFEVSNHLAISPPIFFTQISIADVIPFLSLCFPCLSLDNFTLILKL